MVKVLTLDNGLRVVHEAVPGRRSVALGIWLGRGSRNEAATQNGMTHFCEHLLFKGTTRRSWPTIARDMNLLGGQFNACTSTDWVKLYGSVVSADLPEAFELLCDMFLDSQFPREEVGKEREVILEEIAGYEDVPDELCSEAFSEALLLPHPTGRPVIGTEDLVSAFGAEELAGFWRGALDPERMIVSVAGAFDERELMRVVGEKLGKLPPLRTKLLGMEPAPGLGRRVAFDRDVEQINFCLGVTGPKHGRQDRFAWALYDTILGGGMGSRLFDEVRERRGLAYTIGSSITAMHEAGFLMIGGGTRPETAALAIDLCVEQIRDLARRGVPQDELDTARAQIERTNVMSLESIGTLAGLNGERVLYGLEMLTPEEVVARLRAVTVEDIVAVAKEVESFGEPAMCVVGPMEKVKGLEGMRFEDGDVA